MTDAATDKPCLVITNADDFGLSERENAAILAGFAEGVISSATLMANMPAFEQACQAARQRGLADRLGLHFNLSYGEPLSWSVRGVSALCNVRGQFDFSLPRYSLYLSGQISQAIRTELEAQWQACVEQGLRPTHIDSHQHVHNVLPIAAIVASFAAGHGVPVRLARNVGYNIHPGKAVFKYLLNRLISDGREQRSDMFAPPKICWTACVRRGWWKSFATLSCVQTGKRVMPICLPGKPCIRCWMWPIRTDNWSATVLGFTIQTQQEGLRENKKPIDGSYSSSSSNPVDLIKLCIGAASR